MKAAILILILAIALTGCTDYDAYKLVKSQQDSGKDILGWNKSNETEPALTIAEMPEEYDIIVVMTQEKEIWKITHNGSFYWHGRHVIDDQEIADKVKEFFTNPDEFCKNYTERE